MPLVGGEPYVHLKSDLLERLAEAMPASWLVTSGTTPLKHLPRTVHFVSVDGADAETHNRVRKSRGLFERITKHLERARAEGPFPAFLHVTLNSQNYEQGGPILELWSSNGLVDGVAFSTITPIREAGDEWLRLTEAQRRWIVDELLRQRQRFGDFLLNTEAMIRRLHPDVTAQQTPARCANARYVDSFHANGRQIEQCIFSERGDCAGCGCFVTAGLESIMSPGSFDLQTVNMLRRLLPPFVEARQTHPGRMRLRT